MDISSPHINGIVTKKAETAISAQASVRHYELHAFKMSAPHTKFVISKIETAGDRLE